MNSITLEHPVAAYRNDLKRRIVDIEAEDMAANCDAVASYRFTDEVYKEIAAEILDDFDGESIAYVDSYVDDGDLCAGYKGTLLFYRDGYGEITDVWAADRFEVRVQGENCDRRSHDFSFKELVKHLKSA